MDLPTGVINAAYEDKSYVIGAGSIYSTVDDLFLWTRELLNGSLINEESRKKLFSKQAGRYSYGWFIDTYVWPPINDTNQGLNLHHDGGSPGFESKLSILVDHDVVVIILSNKLPSNLGGLANQITNSWLGFDEELPRPDGSAKLFDVLFNQGVEAAASLIEVWKDADNSHLVPKMSNVFLIGRGYMDSQDYQKAILIMDFLIQEKPKWSYPYLFKAIMLENKKEYKQAIDLYQKVLEIAPKQSNAAVRLSRLRRIDSELESNESRLVQGPYSELLIGFGIFSMIVTIIVGIKRVLRMNSRT